MGAGNADCVLVGLHDDTPSLGPFKHRNPRAAGSSNLRIIIMRRRGADNAVRSLYVLGLMSDRHGNALGNQFIRGNRGIHIGAGNDHAHSLQDQTKWPHGNTANSHKVYMLAGHQVLLQFFISIQHWALPPEIYSHNRNIILYIHSLYNKNF